MQVNLLFRLMTILKLILLIIALSSAARQLVSPQQSQILLHVLLRNAGRVVENRMLIARVWPSEDVFEDTLRVHMHRLRRKLESDSHHPHYVRTERGVGYMFTIRPPELFEDATS